MWLEKTVCEFANHTTQSRQRDTQARRGSSNGQTTVKHKDLVYRPNTDKKDRLEAYAAAAKLNQ